MLSCSIWFSAPSFWMGGGLESRCVVRAYGADGARQHPHHTQRPTQQLSKTQCRQTICCNSTSNAPDDGRMYLKHVELRIHQYNYLVASSWHFKLFYCQGTLCLPGSTLFLGICLNILTLQPDPTLTHKE